MSALTLLDNIMWNALSGPHAQFASGRGDVRRYAPGFSPIVGFADPTAPDFNALLPFCSPGEHFYTDVESKPSTSEWQIDTESTMFRMVWQAGVPANDEAPDAIPLGREHAQQALDLALLTKPGPFGLRTIELGEYFGYFENGKLIAIAGERMWAGDLREISGVCTHPDYQGRGIARRLMLKLIRREMLRGETPFLHVMHNNTGARALYEKMGFRNYRETVVRVIARRS